MSELHFWTGPVSSGKTTAMLDMMARYARMREVVVIRPDRSARAFEGEETGIIVSKAQRSFQCYNFGAISDSLCSPFVQEADVVGIDEVGIFTDIECVHPAVHGLMSRGKTVCIAGLVTTSEGKPWSSGVSDLWALSDHAHRLAADCDACGVFGTATRSLHIGEDAKTDIVKVGGTESYVAVCPPCWTKLIRIRPDADRRHHLFPFS